MMTRSDESQVPEMEPTTTDEASSAPSETPSPDEMLVEPENALDRLSLDDLPDDMKRAAANANWTHLMRVQAMAIPYVLANRDLMVQSRTGSGKTGAYLLPILHRIDTHRPTCQALVLVPTRELARQVSVEAEMLGADSGVRSVAVYGGVGYGPQIDAFRKGAHLVIGTPGRILDHLIKRSLSLDGLRMLVFDEADRMLSMGFYPDMKRVQEFLPNRPISGYMFSATFPPHVMRLANQFLKEPEFLGLSQDHVHVMETEHVYYPVSAMDKDRSLVRIIEEENPASALVFCNTRTRVHYVAVVLQRFGFSASELSSDLSQQARELVLRRLRQGEIRFLVATDVAARGIDIPDLSHVFLYELPEDVEIYIHRAGRTGRAGASGVAVSLVDGLELRGMQRIASRYKIQFEKRDVPTDEDVQGIVAERCIAALEAAMRERDSLKTERMQRFVPLAQELAKTEEGLSLLAMLLDDAYHASFHASRHMIPTEEPERVQQRPSGNRGSSPGRRPRRRRR